MVFWSRKELSNILTRPVRIMVYAAASFAALRLEHLVDGDPNLTGSYVRLTPRELAVLRLVSTGAQLREVAQGLGLGEETVRSHMKKAQSKLGVRHRTQAVAEALRQHLYREGAWRRALSAAVREQEMATTLTTPRA